MRVICQNAVIYYSLMRDCVPECPLYYIIKMREALSMNALYMIILK